ncbi:MAG: heavy-metal-associated domain-containing protein [Pseudonocardia sp.]|nr:heavy-metal-associated domain-containing protein [Pseudonocardia sp.]
MTVQSPYQTTISVTGMSCQHCVNAITEEISALSGVQSVEVTLSTGRVIITSDRELSGTEIAEAVTEAGYSVAR